MQDQFGLAMRDSTAWPACQTGTLRVVEVEEHGTNSLLVHDAHAENPEVAFALSRLADPTSLRTTAIGIYRDVYRPTYDDLLHQQLAVAAQDNDAPERERLERLIAGNDTWTVTA